MAATSVVEMSELQDSYWGQRDFLRWWLLPSYDTHPSWLPQLLADFVPLETFTSEGVAGSLRAQLHAHWSAQLLEQPDAQALHAITAHSALPILIAPRPLREAVLLQAAMVIVHPLLRRYIDRSTREHIAQALGAQALPWAVREGPNLHPGLPQLTTLEQPPLTLLQSMARLGQHILLHALSGAPAVLHTRIHHAFPASWQTLPAPALHGLTPNDACTLCLHLLNALDPTWFSSLPKTH